MKVKIIFDGAGDWSTTWIEELIVCDCKGKQFTATGLRHCCGGQAHKPHNPGDEKGSGRCVRLRADGSIGPLPPHARTQTTQIPKGAILEADLEDGSLRSKHLKEQITPFPSGYRTARILEEPARKPAP